MARRPCRNEADSSDDADGEVLAPTVILGRFADNRVRMLRAHCMHTACACTVCICRLPGQGGGSWAFSILVLMANMLAQGLFVYAVFAALRDNADIKDDTAGAYRTWRLNSAHSLDNVDTLTGVALAARVCMGDDGLNIGTGQADAYKKLSAYLQTSIIGVEFGPLVLVLCISIWSLRVMTEISSALALTAAVWGLKGDVTTTTACGDVDQDPMRISTLSLTRVCCFLVVQV